MCHLHVFCALLALLARVSLQVTAISINCGALEVLEHQDLHCVCLLRNSESSVRWTLAFSTGDLADLGTCRQTDSCVQNIYPGVNLTRTVARTSTLVLRDAGLEDTGNIVCAEHFTNGSVATANFTLNVVSVRLSPCDSGEYDVTEKTNVTMRCDVSDASSVIRWSLVSTSGHKAILGTCDVSNCSSSLAPYLVVTRNSMKEESGRKRAYSHMTIRGISRGTAGTVTCYDGRQTSYCTLDVEHETLVSRCGLDVYVRDWTVEIWCEVHFAFSALGRYEYTVHEMWKPKGSRYYHEQFSPMFDGRQSFEPHLSNVSGTVYYEGTYRHLWPLSPGEGTYTYRTVTFPGKVTRRIEREVHVERPMSPSVQCHFETACVCSTPSVGQPQGRLVWLSGDTVLAAGEYGETELLLSRDKMADGAEKVNIMCQLDWIVKENVTISETFYGGAMVTWAGVVVGAVLVLLVAVVVVAVFAVLWRRGRLPCGLEISRRTVHANHSNQTSVLYCPATAADDTEHLIRA